MKYDFLDTVACKWLWYNVYLQAKDELENGNKKECIDAYNFFISDTSTFKPIMKILGLDDDLTYAYREKIVKIFEIRKKIF